MSRSFTLAGRPIGQGRCFVIAEAGVNHNGEIGKALALVDVAAAAGADAVKFQTFSAARIAVADAPKARYQERDQSPTQREMLRRLELDEPMHRQLIARAAERRSFFFSSPFDEISADLPEKLDIAAFKIPSGELTNTPFLRHVAAKRRPMIVSTGMANLDEVCDAVAAIGSKAEAWPCFIASAPIRQNRATPICGRWLLLRIRSTCRSAGPTTCSAPKSPLPAPHWARPSSRNI